MQDISRPAPQNAAGWHLQSLDSLRGIAVLGVVLVHSVFWDNLPLPLPPWFQAIAFSGQRGVQLFFLVSAFTLSWSHEKRRKEHGPLRNYAIRRFFRIAPMFYMGIVLTWFFFHRQSGPVGHVVLAALFLNGFSPKAISDGMAGGWTIANEAMFYMVLPLLLRFVQSLRAAFATLVVAGVSLYLLTSAWAAHYPHDPRYSAYAQYAQFLGFPVEFPVFLGGMAAYFFWRECIRGRDGQTARTVSTAMLFGCGVLYFGALPFTNANLYPTALLCALLLLAVLVHPWRFLVNNTTAWLGKISFSIYILHFFGELLTHAWLSAEVEAHPVVNRAFVRFVVNFCGTLLLTIPASYLTWRFVEEPGRRFGSRLIRTLESRAS